MQWLARQKNRKSSGRGSEMNRHKEYQPFSSALACVSFIGFGMAGLGTALPVNAATGDAPAEQPEGGQLMEIVVTAQRRSQNLQDVPVAVDVVTGAELAGAGISTTLDLGQVTPGLEIG